MPLLDMAMDLQKIPPRVYRALIDELSENSAWKVVAEYLVEKCSERFSIQWLKSLERESSFTTPKRAAELLINELIAGLCTVRILCTILRNCDVGYALYLLRGHEPLEIITQPQSNANGRPTEIAFGETFTLSCKATGLPPPRYQWLHENEELVEHKTSNLSLTITSPDQVGGYQCRVDHYDRDDRRLDEKYSEFVTLKIKPVPVTITLQPSSVDTIVGDNYVLNCEATGYPAPRYQWFKENRMLKDETSSTYRRTNVSFEDEGVYYCHVTNDTVDLISNKIKVTVDPPAEKALAKIALLIGNNDYINNRKLSKPENDVAAIGKQLMKIGFHVWCLKNLTRVEMKNAIHTFSRALIPGVYGFFYFAGHGMLMHDPRMEPIDVPKCPSLKDTISQNELLQMTLQQNPAFLVVVLDMCLEVPDKKENERIHNERQDVIEFNNNKNHIIAYSTCHFEPSLEGQKAKNGVYASHLIKHITEPKPAFKLFYEVARSVSRLRRGGSIQTPEISLVGSTSYRLTDAIDRSKHLDPIIQSVIDETTFKSMRIDQLYEPAIMSWQFPLIIEPLRINLHNYNHKYLNPPFLNGLRITILGVEQEEHYLEFLRYDDPSETDVSRLREHQSDISIEAKGCCIHNPQRHNPKAGLLILIGFPKKNPKSLIYGRLSYLDKLPVIVRNLNRKIIGAQILQD